jgi:hypothetical protein
MHMPPSSHFTQSPARTTTMSRIQGAFTVYQLTDTEVTRIHALEANGEHVTKTSKTKARVQSDPNAPDSSFIVLPLPRCLSRKVSSAQ